MADGRAKHVLVVEDDLSTAELERRALARVGMRTHIASCIHDAKALLGQRAVDAVVLDYKLPDGDPWEIIEMARSLTPRVPLILVTAAGSEGIVTEAIHRGVDDYIRKSDGFWEQLAARIDHVAKQVDIETQLRRNSALLELITEHASDLIIALDAAGVIRYLSPACRSLLGYEATELLGKPFLDIVHPEDRAKRTAKGQFHARSDHRHDIFRCYRHDKALLWVEADFQPICGFDNNEVLEILGILRDITERRLTEERLRQSEEQFRSAFETAPHGMALVSIEGRRLKVNEAVCDILGYSRDELLATDVQAVSYPDDLNTDQTHRHRLLAGEVGSYQIEMRYFHKRGHIVQALLSVSLVRDAAEQPAHFVEQILDITERKRTEDELRRFNEVLEETVEARTREVRMQAAVLQTQNRRLALLAKASERLILGDDVGAALADIFDDFAEQLEVDFYSHYVIDPERPDRLILERSTGLTEAKREFLRYLRFGEGLSGVVAQMGVPLVLEDVLQRSDDMTAIARAMGVKSYAGHPLMVHGRLLGTLAFWSTTRSHFNADDVALMRTLCDQAAAAMDRARLLHETHAAEERFRQVVESAPNAMVMVDTAGRIEMVNRKAEYVFGYPRRELLGKSVNVLVPERFRGEDSDLRNRLFVAPSSRAAGTEIYARGKDSSEFPVEIALSPFETKEGKMVLSSIVDISERKAAEARIQDALREKDLLLAEIHHRVKNNLQIVNSLLSLQSESVVDESVLSLLRESQNRIRSMAIIHQTLYESNSFEAVDFSRFLESLVPILISSYGSEAKGVVVRINVSDVMLPISVAVPCGLVANELVSNALKHAFPHGRGGEITIELAGESGGDVRLSVTDTGIGMPKDFDLATATTLGLQLVTELATQLSGTLAIEPANPTRFRLIFPTSGTQELESLTTGIIQ